MPQGDLAGADLSGIDLAVPPPPPDLATPPAPDLTLAASCNDLKQNGDETDFDCGGSCKPCGGGKMCVKGKDCASALCINNLCAAPTCIDGLKNQDETDIDCGGLACGKCAIGKGCASAADCLSNACTNNLCQLPLCQNGKKDGNETSIDCGGGTCPQCGIGQFCLQANDCVSANCVNNVCANPPTCNDFLKNGKETDVDCGGGTCLKCGDNKMCVGAADCLSGMCTNGSCKAGPNCNDGVKNALETDTDCGGGTCNKCNNGQMCLVNADCASTSCVNKLCVMGAGNCFDNLQNGTETDVDCGGLQCGLCLDGQKCKLASDCQRNACTNLVCGANAAYTFSGVKSNLPIANLTGWTECHLDLYSGTGVTAIPIILQKCSKANLTMACRQTGSNTLLLAAMAPRDHVSFLTVGNTPHLANGVNWYRAASWGFAAQGSAILLTPCDTNPGADRLCWHATGQNGTLSGGYRCGSITALNASNAYQRVVYHAN
ncbi:MAG: hypothetical protein EXR72_07230 [Myxococcales bacterium]|nr:hypothetical protein [Myxococcales bacterium]